MRCTALVVLLVLTGCPPASKAPACPHCADNDDADGDGFTPADGDCDDTDPDIHPDAEEICDERDNNCDEQVDVSATDATNWYPDEDGDGHGNLLGETAACTAPSQHVTDSNDCDDTDAAVHPDATERCDLVDNDCDGTTDEPDAEDAKAWFSDNDSDGHGDSEGEPVYQCTAPEGHSETNDDCDDDSAAQSPSLVEVCSDGLDNDCDGDDNDCIKTGTRDLDTDNDVVDVHILGGSANASVGSNVQALADLDGDGANDVAVTSGTLDDTALDKIFVLTASFWDEAERDMSVDVPATHAVLSHPQSDARLGTSIDSAAAGDGTTWIAIGAPGLHEGAGAALVLSYAGESGSIMLSMDALSANIMGNTSTGGQALGAQVALGHLDEDDEVDLLIGAPGTLQGGEFVGAVYMVSGPLTGGSDSVADAATRAFIGTIPNAGAGSNVKVIGDMNGDGISEIAVGAPASGEDPDGRVYVIWGGGSHEGQVELSTADVQLVVSSGSEQGLGAAIDTAHDVDGDGLNDLILGAPRAEGNRGRAYVVFGAEDIPHGDITGTDPLILNGDSGQDQAGTAVAGIGDMNGDGAADLAIGAPGHNEASGRAYIVYGPHEPGTLELRDTDLILEGETSLGRAGATLAAAGDVNLDDHADLLVGVPYYGEGDSESEGSVFLVEGRGW